MNIPDHISESLETIFWLKILKFFDADPDPGSGIRNLFDHGSGSGMANFGSGIKIPDSQHCQYQPAISVESRRRKKMFI
jgi:hypothetical protein